MEIQPLCPELIAKLEIAVAHRNRERALTVVGVYFDKIGARTPSSCELTLSDLLPLRLANRLHESGFVYVSDLVGVSEEHLLAVGGIGTTAIKTIRKKLEQLRPQLTSLDFGSNE